MNVLQKPAQNLYCIFLDISKSLFIYLGHCVSKREKKDIVGFI